MSMLVSQEGEKVWGEKRIGYKVDIVAQIVGFKHRINTGRDQICMQRYLSEPGLQIWLGYAYDAQPGAVPASRCLIIWFMIQASLKG